MKKMIMIAVNATDQFALEAVPLLWGPFTILLIFDAEVKAC